MSNRVHVGLKEERILDIKFNPIGEKIVSVYISCDEIIARLGVVDDIEEVFKIAGPEFLIETMKENLSEYELECIMSVLECNDYTYYMFGEEYNAKEDKGIKLTDEEKASLIEVFYNCYYDTNQDTKVFATEFYEVVGTILSGFTPTKLNHLAEFEEYVVEAIPRLKEIYKKKDGVDIMEKILLKIGKINEDGTIERGHSDQGMIYKNEEAFINKSGVCYIPELNDIEYSYNDFLDIALGDEKIAGILFEAVDWQSPDTLVDEWLNDNELFYCNKCKQYYLGKGEEDKPCYKCK